MTPVSGSKPAGITDHEDVVGKRAPGRQGGAQDRASLHIQHVSFHVPFHGHRHVDAQTVLAFDPIQARIDVNGLASASKAFILPDHIPDHVMQEVGTLLSTTTLPDRVSFSEFVHIYLREQLRLEQLRVCVDNLKKRRDDMAGDSNLRPVDS